MSLVRKLALSDGEAIVATIRRYRLTDWWRYGAGFLFLGLTAFFSSWLLSQGVLGRGLLALGLFVGAFTLFHSWFFHHHTALVITTKRVVDIYRHSWLSEKITSLGYESMGDVGVERHGFTPLLLNYGNVVIVANDNDLVIAAEGIKRPIRVGQIIRDQRERFLENRTTRTATTLVDYVIAALETLPPADVLRLETAIRARLDTEFQS